MNKYILLFHFLYIYNSILFAGNCCSSSNKQVIHPIKTSNKNIPEQQSLKYEITLSYLIDNFDRNERQIKESLNFNISTNNKLKDLLDTNIKFATSKINNSQVHQNLSQNIQDILKTNPQQPKSTYIIIGKGKRITIDVIPQQSN